jgi:hypothetical protein
MTEPRTGPHCTCPAGWRHADGCALFNVRAAYRQGAEAAAPSDAHIILSRWPEADLFAALDAEGWFRGLDTAEATRATKKVYARLAAAPSDVGLREALEYAAGFMADPEGLAHRRVEWLAKVNAALARQGTEAAAPSDAGLRKALALVDRVIFDLPIGDDVAYSRGYSAGTAAARESLREALQDALAPQGTES